MNSKRIEGKVETQRSSASVTHMTYLTPCDISNAQGLKRILAAQEKILTYLFEDFAEYLDTEEVRTVRESYDLSLLNTI
jgi:hypothetical protein